eukprot:3914728-Rhodomonas_salina.1
MALRISVQEKYGLRCIRSCIRVAVGLPFGLGGSIFEFEALVSDFGALVYDFGALVFGFRLWPLNLGGLEMVFGGLACESGARICELWAVVFQIHCEINDKTTQSECNLYQECGFLYLISGCRGTW